MEEFEKLINDYFDGDEDAEKRLDYFIDDEIGQMYSLVGRIFSE